MSYSGLGQTKFIPGQVNFLAPHASNPERYINRRLARGLPYAPYIEHGSWATGEPDLVTWNRPQPSLGSGDGLGQILTDLACSGTALNASWTTRTRDAMGAATQAAVVGGLLAGIVGGVSKKPAIGAIVGAGLAFVAFRAWTAPYVV